MINLTLGWYFIISVDGVESVTLPDGTVVTDAEDMVLCRPIRSHEDYLLLQRDINAIADWIARLHLQRISCGEVGGSMVGRRCSLGDLCLWVLWRWFCFTV